MYVIGINGSPRKKRSSAIMLENALQGAKDAGAEVERVDLVNLKFSGCRSCFACKLVGGKSFGKCAIRDDLSEILEKIINADAVIISTPIYFGNVPGMVRNLFERIWFPALTYKKDGTIAYTKRVKTGLIYTMGMPNLSQVGDIIKADVENFEYFLGKTEVITAHETPLYDNYDGKYIGDHKVELKKKIREEQFPLECQKAYELGKNILSEEN